MTPAPSRWGTIRGNGIVPPTLPARCFQSVGFTAEMDLDADLAATGLGHVDVDELQHIARRAQGFEDDCLMGDIRHPRLRSPAATPFTVSSSARCRIDQARRRQAWPAAVATATPGGS